MELVKIPQKVASLGVNFLTKNGVGICLLKNLEENEQVRLQLVFSPTYHRITQLNIPPLQKPKQQTRVLLDMGKDKKYDVKSTRKVVIEG